MAWCRACGDWSEAGSAASSRASTRCSQRARRCSGSIGLEGLGAVGFGRVAEQPHAQFRLFQRGLALAVEADAAFVRGQRIIEREVALLHLLDQLLEFVERGFE